MSALNAGASAAASAAVAQKQVGQSLPVYTFMDTGAGGIPAFTCLPEAMVPNLVGLPAGITVSSNELTTFALNLLTSCATSGDRQFLISHEIATPDSSMADAASQGTEINPQIFMQYFADSTANITSDASSFSIPSLSELNATGSMEQVSNDLNVGAQELVLDEGERAGADGKRHPLHID